MNGYDLEDFVEDIIKRDEYEWWKTKKGNDHVQMRRKKERKEERKKERKKRKKENERHRSKCR